MDAGTVRRRSAGGAPSRIQADVVSEISRDGGDDETQVVVDEVGMIVVRGRVSAGRRGWSLSGSVNRRRRRLLLQLCARRTGDDRTPDIESYSYSARLLHVPPGSFDVFVSCMFLVPGVPVSLPEPRFVGTVEVPSAPRGLTIP